MSKPKYVKVKFLKRHHRFAYIEGDKGLVKEATLKELNLVGSGFVELVKEEKKQPLKATEKKTDKK